LKLQEKVYKGKKISRRKGTRNEGTWEVNMERNGGGRRDQKSKFQAKALVSAEKSGFASPAGNNYTERGKAPSSQLTSQFSKLTIDTETSKLFRALGHVTCHAEQWGGA
jgi:hypothetical protein